MRKYLSADIETIWKGGFPIKWDNHEKEVASISCQLAVGLGLSSVVCNKIKTAAYLHDEGKYKLDQTILNKSEKLTTQEFDHVKRHVYYGLMAALNFGQYDREILEMIFFHHENFDGSGYYLNLHGDEIPMGARILRVADVFAALKEERSYKGAFRLDEVIRIMDGMKGSFDPLVFQKLKELYVSNALNQKFLYYYQ